MQMSKMIYAGQGVQLWCGMLSGRGIYVVQEVQKGRETLHRSITAAIMDLAEKGIEIGEVRV
jgi:hypothetical protein